MSPKILKNIKFSVSAARLLGPYLVRMFFDLTAKEAVARVALSLGFDGVALHPIGPFAVGQECL